MDLILASTSVYRRQLLERLRLPFRIEPSYVDEDELKDAGLPPLTLAKRLAAAKAQTVATEHPNAVVIGGDQLVAFNGEVLGKPGTAERAVAQLLALSGHEHELITAIAVHKGDTRVTHTDRALLRLRKLSQMEAERYVMLDNPVDCAGSYKLESLGISLFDRIVADDHSAIVGLPLIALSGILRSFGFRVP